MIALIWGYTDTQYQRIMSELRSLPSVDQLLKTPPVIEWLGRYGRPLTLDAIRVSLDEARVRYRDGGGIPDQDMLLKRTEELLEAWVAPTLEPVINASGVILHTNLGRAPLSKVALLASRDVSLGYSSLEYDLKRGKRGSRLIHTEALLQRLTGAEAAVVVYSKTGGCHCPYSTGRDWRGVPRA